MANINISDFPAEMRPGEIYNVTFQVTIPTNASMYAMTEISLPVNESAVMTVLEMTLVGIDNVGVCFTIRHIMQDGY